MKKGLLIYPHNSEGIFNIGDYVQSIAARQFIGKPDVFVKRENLDNYRGEPIKLIMNGWYMHNPNNWPPADNIEPLFIAFHLNKLAEKGMLTPSGIEYFKKHEPIGCRDMHTVDLLKSKGIDAYFSGCLTLTLGKTYRHTKVSDAQIYLTDLNSTLKHNLKFKINCAFVAITKLRTLKTIQTRMLECGVLKRFRTVTAFYATYRNVISDEVLISAQYREQEIEDNFVSDDEKFLYAEKLLQEYSKAQYVVTSRIHCALPCLAMGTPVVFITNDLIGDIHNCRLDGLKQLFHTIEIGSNGIRSKIPGISKLTKTTIFKNKSNHETLKDKLIIRCKAFIDED